MTDFYEIYTHISPYVDDLTFDYTGGTFYDILQRSDYEPGKFSYGDKPINRNNLLSFPTDYQKITISIAAELSKMNNKPSIHRHNRVEKGIWISAKQSLVYHEDGTSQPNGNFFIREKDFLDSAENALTFYCSPKKIKNKLENSLFILPALWDISTKQIINPVFSSTYYEKINSDKYRFYSSVNQIEPDYTDCVFTLKASVSLENNLTQL
jgi:hypothetical protein